MEKCGAIFPALNFSGQNFPVLNSPPPVPKIDLQFRAPLINFIFFLRKNFLMFVGAGFRRRSPGCHPPPPPAAGNGAPWPVHVPGVGSSDLQGLSVYFGLLVRDEDGPYPPPQKKCTPQGIDLGKTLSMAKGV